MASRATPSSTGRHPHHVSPDAPPRSVERAAAGRAASRVPGPRRHRERPPQPMRPGRTGSTRAAGGAASATGMGGADRYGDGPASVPPRPRETPARAPLASLNARIIRCRLCPRLVTHREAVGAIPPPRYRGQTYWARPLPGFGDARARLLLVGLAPAAHGGNRTGRMFTGDQSGTWLFRALHEAGFAKSALIGPSRDGLRLHDAYITAALRCAPPGNKPSLAERLACRPYLLEELRRLSRVRVIVGLGRIGWTAYLQARRALALPPPVAPPVFGHDVQSRFADGSVLLGCYHPSQQNTFTGKLTRPMLRQVFVTARALLMSERAAPIAPHSPGSRRAVRDVAGPP